MSYMKHWDEEKTDSAI